MSSHAEAVQEIGRRGALEAKALLERLLPNALDLPFNAYDSAEKLTFADGPQFGGEGAHFLFDLGGTLKRNSPHRFGRSEAAEVFVEVKTRAVGNSTLVDYREFLRRASVASLQPRHRNSWFLFYSNVPFGSSFGEGLVDGSLLRKCRESWPSTMPAAAPDLELRITLVIATGSFVRMLSNWIRDD